MDDFAPRVYLWLRAVLLAVGIVTFGGLGEVSAARAQSADSLAGPSAAGAAPSVRWTLIVDGAASDWPGGAPDAPVDSLRAVARRVLASLQRDGFVHATVDSARIDTVRGDTVRDAIVRGGALRRVRLFVRSGPRVRVGRIRFTGTDTLSADVLRGVLQTRPGQPFDADRLEADLDAVVARYQDAGRLLAQVRIAETRLRGTDPPVMDVTLAVDEGPALWLKRVALPDAARTSPRWVARVAGLDVGAPLPGYDPAALRRTLRDTGLFRSVGAPELRVEPDGGAVLFVPVRESPPGAFDVVLGYLPPASASGSGQLVGSGHLGLENVFGGGRTAELTLDRRPGRVSLFDVAVSDPFVLGGWLRVDARFRGEQRDSTYGKRHYTGALGVRIADGVAVRGSITREATRPGEGGLPLRGTRQRIPRADALFYGVGVRLRRVDRPDSPRRGLTLSVDAEQGRKTQRFRQAVDADTTVERRSLRQDRLHAAARVYVPLLARQVVVTGGEASVLRSDVYDRSDLFRIGGATSLRGYDEDRFLGSVVARALVEHRLLIDRVSYAYVFGDVGYVQRPDLPDAAPTRGWHPGFGLGIRFGTALGLVNASYALNTDDATPANGRIHLGLSVEL